MVAKLIITAFTVFCFVEFATGSSVATQLCKSQSDCRPTECCSKRFMTDRSYCVPRRKLNEICIANGGSTMINGVYDITCPCEGNLKCIKEEYTEPNGILMTKELAKCRKPDYTGSSSYNPYEDSGAFASANSYGNSYSYSHS